MSDYVKEREDFIRKHLTRQIPSQDKSKFEMACDWGYAKGREDAEREMASITCLDCGSTSIRADRLEHVNQDFLDRIIELEDKLKKAEDALEFYAEFCPNSGMIEDVIKGGVYVPLGERAEKTLAEIRGEGSEG